MSVATTRLLFATLLLALIPLLSRAQGDRFLLDTTPMPIQRAFHGSAVLGDFFYVFGGAVQQAPGEALIAAWQVHVAQIGPNGQLMVWGETTSLPEPRFYIENSTIVLNDTVYILGGSDAVLNGNRANTILWTRPMATGHLYPWQRSAPFDGVGVSCTAAFSTPGYLHMTGGTGQGDYVTNKVWSVRINADGSPGQWEEAPSLPVPLWYHCAVAVGGRAYAWGGLQVDAPGNVVAENKVYSAPVLGTGQLGPWREEPTTLPQGFYAASSAVAGPYVFAMCPRYGPGKESNDIWWSYITPQGMRPWEKRETSIPMMVYRATSTDYRRGLIYVTGGKGTTGDNPLPTSVIVALSDKARRLAEEGWQYSQQAGQTSVSSTEYAEQRARQGTQSQVSFEGGGGRSGLPGFQNLDEARQIVSRNRKPLIMYFNIDTAQPCQEQATFFAEDGFRSLTDQAVFASVDAGLYPQLAQQYGVFRVPTWVFYDSRGIERTRLVGVQSLDDLAPRIASLP